MTGLSDFKNVVFADFEFVSKSGEHPDVVCLAWHEEPAGQTHCLWRDQLGATPPYPIDDKTLFVCFVANAELGCHLALNWPLPRHVLDLNPEFRRLTNGRLTPAGKGLLGALAYFNLDSITSKHKDAMRDRIMRGWPFTAEERADILRYGAGDVDALVRLLPRLLPRIGDLDHALFRGQFVAASALMEHRGVPIDMAIFRRLADKRAWSRIRDAMVPTIDQEYGVYAKGKDGDWHFSLDLFGAYLRREGISWPLTETGKLSVKGKVFESMTKGIPQLENLRQLRHARDKLRSIKLAVGADARNRAVLWPYKSKSGRTQPKASQWIFSPAVWLRGLIQPAPGSAIAYIDWSSMEFLIAGALSGDPVMLEFYRDGDPYLSFPKRVGLAPGNATKASHGALRDRYKVGLLAAQYGIQADGLAARLGISGIEAHEMLAQHRELFAVYWQWTRDWVAQALKSGTMRTVFDWQCATGITEFNERSIANFPVQSAGSNILQLAVVWATRHGLRLLAPVHDALVIEAPLEQIDRDVTLLQEIMRRASRVILNPSAEGTIALRTDAVVVRHPDRYADKRGSAIWQHVLALLDEQGEQQAAARG